jgi:glycosyltransferase involved in cell wall biosynthesis
MKILLATFWSIPHVGGVWNYMLQLKEKLESFGHEVDLLGNGENNNFVHMVTKNDVMDQNRLIPVITKIHEETESSLYNEDQILKYYESLRYCYELSATYFDLEKYDLIHTQDVLSTACINRVRPDETPLVATLHGSVAQELKHYATQVHITPTSNLVCEYFDKIEYTGATAATHTIVANEWLKNILMKEFHVPSEQLRVFHYGYDIEAFINRMNERSTIQRPANKKVILYAGRLVELKGVHHLISALSQLKGIRNDWVCWIAGDGSKQSDLQQQTKVLGLEQDVIFLGKRDDIPQLLSNSDIFVFPSLLDNQPLAVIEAQIAGKPVIVSDAGGLPEMVEHGATGLISSAGDERALSLNIDYLLTHENYRESLGSNAKKWAISHWSIDTAVKNVLDIYQSALSKKKNGL